MCVSCGEPAMLHQQILQQLTQSSYSPDASFDFKAEVIEPAAPEAYMEYKLKNVMITSYQTGGAGDFAMCDGSVRSDESPEESDFSADVNGDTVTGTVTFGGSITLQNVREVDTLNDWFQI